MAKFEGQERRMPGINACLKEYGMNTLEDARDLALAHGINVEEIVKGVQPIAFDNAVWAYTLGVALALKKGVKSAAEASEMIGVGLQAFCVPGSVAEQRQVGLGHGNLGAMLLRDENQMLLLFGRTRILCGGGGCHRHCPQRQQSPQGAAARDSERSGQGRCLYHQPHQRLYLCRDRL